MSKAQWPLWILAVLPLLVALLSMPAMGAALIPAEPQHVRSLDGTWRFKVEQIGEPPPAAQNWQGTAPIKLPKTFEPFFKPDYKEGEGWVDLPVPGNWEMAGLTPASYNNPDNSSGFYRKTFDVPAEWRGRRVLIQFEGVWDGAEVFINGEPANVDEPSWDRPNYHESGWTAFQVDLTPHVKFGEKNLIALRVTKNTRSVDLDTGDTFTLSGIYRPVTLFSVPEQHITDLTVSTALAQNGDAEVTFRVAAAGGDLPVRVDLRDADGRGETIYFIAGAGEISHMSSLAKPRLWSAERPELYDLTVQLLTLDNKVLQTIKRRVGIRDVKLVDGVLTVNNVPVRLAGVCRHEVDGPLGTALTVESWKRDLLLMKANNINAVRTSHYPYASAFYDLCDELGMYVVSEMPFCWTPTDDPEMQPAFDQRTREEVRRNKNHPSILFWALGNENRPPGRNIEAAAKLLSELDPSRPYVISEQGVGTYGAAMADHHYTTPVKMAANRAVADGTADRATARLAGESTARQADTENAARERPHGHVWLENPNVFEVRWGVDPGCWDLWGIVLKRCWDEMEKSDRMVGLFPWEWADRAIADKGQTKYYDHDPVTGVHYLKLKGMVDSNRNPRPQLFHTKMVYAPLRIEGEAKRDGNAITFDVRNAYSFTDLSEIQTTCTPMRDGKPLSEGAAIKVAASVPPRSTGQVRVEAAEAEQADTLRVAFANRNGTNIATYDLKLKARSSPAKLDAALPEGVTFPNLNLSLNVQPNRAAATNYKIIEREYAKLANVRLNGADTTEDALLKTPLGEVKQVEADIVVDPRALPSEATTRAREQFERELKQNPIKTTGDNKAIVGRLRATFADGRFGYTIEWTAAHKPRVHELGWVFAMPAADRFSWQREALWSYYPDDHIGRPAGTATPDSADVRISNVTRPDAFDFNSTKYDCNWARLTNASGRGLRLEFSPEERHHVRGGFAASDGHFYQGGTEPTLRNGQPLAAGSGPEAVPSTNADRNSCVLVVNAVCSPGPDLSTNIVPELTLTMERGKTIERSFRIGASSTGKEQP